MFVINSIDQIMENTKFLNYCLNNLDLDQPDQFNEYLSCVPICVINAIFSINTKYEAVINVQKHFCEHFNLNIYSQSKGEIPPTNSQKTVTEIYNLIKDIKPEILASEIFKNRQRTSTTNGILKTDAVLRFLKILKDFHAETYSDISNLTNNETFEECIKTIPGQNSGISLKYFFMLQKFCLKQPITSKL